MFKKLQITIFGIFVLLFLASLLQARSLHLQSAITIDSIQGHGFEFENLNIIFDTALPSTYQIEISKVSLPDNNGLIKDIKLICLNGLLSMDEIVCEKGKLSFRDPVIEAHEAAVSFAINKNNEIKLNIDDIQVADGSASIVFEMQQEGWRAEINSKNIEIAELHKKFTILAEFSFLGELSGLLSFEGVNSLINSVSGDVLLSNSSFTNVASSMVGESFAARTNFVLARADKTWMNEFSTTLFSGELYFDPIFIEPGNSPIDIFGKLSWHVDSTIIQFDELHYEDQHALHAYFSTDYDYEIKEIISPLDMHVEYATFPTVYDVYIQPFLIGSNLSELDTSGSFNGAFVFDDGTIFNADFKLSNVSIKDKQNRFALTGLNGNVGWGESYSNTKYEFGFGVASIYKFDLGETTFSFLNNGTSLVLTKAAKVPLLDGAIKIESFIVERPGKEDQAIKLDVNVTPISMLNISSLFAWPEMSGNLSGYAPNVSYQQGNLDVQGALLIRGFGGATTIHNLKAEELFSITPKLFADIKINNLDLTSLTETFSFGEITGKLDGSIKDMQLLNWHPMQFDAWFGTPENDATKHRISQKAVDNLTSLGNGISSSFVKTYLQFIESFGYDQIGIGCRLENGTCVMQGVADSASDNANSNTRGGFYIVKGRGIPRIDIIGFTKRVSWSTLVKRLQRITDIEDVVVQ